mmetsp:Transcript_10802/g.12325  ORF Transcript_10802/g.12325 Transcript_10802/m.12325 type:complete len:81 (+) Transcript_10802:354-596(+)
MDVRGMHRLMQTQASEWKQDPRGIRKRLMQSDKPRNCKTRGRGGHASGVPSGEESQNRRMKDFGGATSPSCAFQKNINCC